MKNNLTFPKLLAAAAVVILFADKPAHAYLDAGTGSMVIQLLLAGTAGASVLLKVVWQRVRDYFNSSKD